MTARRPLAKRVLDAFVLAVVVVLSVLARSGLRRLVGRLAATLAGSVLRHRRRETEARMRAAGVADPSTVAGAMYDGLGRGLAELLSLDDEVLARVRFTPAAEAALARLRETGAIVLTAHLANWDLSACAVARRAPLVVVTKRLSNAGLDRRWQSLRADRGVTLVPPEGATLRVLAALGEKKLVAMMIDQAPLRARGTRRATFLGLDVDVDLAPLLLAVRARVPVVLAVAHREGDVQILDVPWSAEPTCLAAAERAALDAQAALEAFVLAHPAEWLWLHRRGRSLPAAPVRALAMEAARREA